MPTQLPQRELRNHSGEILARVGAGEEITITVRGRPVADLVPTRQGGRVAVGHEAFLAGLRGLLTDDDALAGDLGFDDDEAVDPWQRRGS